MPDSISQSSRKLPFSLEAEQSVLGSILIDPEKFDDITRLISHEDFYLAEHQEIFSAMEELSRHNKEIDHVILTEELVRLGVYDVEQAKQYIMTIADIVPSSENVIDYAQIVRSKSRLRRLISVCGDIEEDAYAEGEDAETIIKSAEGRIFELSNNQNQSDFTHIKPILLETYSHLEELRANPEQSMGVSTGFSGVDNLLVGMGEGNLILVGARPGMGKTSFALNIASNVAHRSGKQVCIFSLEMSKEELVSRMLSSEALIESRLMRSGMLEDDDFEKLAKAASYLSSCDIYIDDSTGSKVSGMLSKLRRMKNLGLVVVDYLQLMQSERRKDGNRVNEVAEISRDLKIMAKELRVPVICCSQLSRVAETRQDSRPMLSDLRDSGAIEQDADIVMFISRDYYNKDPAKMNTAEIIVAKNRHGKTGSVELNWFGQYTKFSTRSDQEAPQ